MLLSEYFPRWLAAHAPSVRPSTILAHRTRITKHLLPRIGSIELDALDTFAIQSLYGDLLVAGLSPRSVHGIHQTLSAALRQAVKWRLITHNVCEEATLPRCERYEAHTLTAAQVRVLFDKARRTRLYAAWVVFIASGLRRGELLALRWADVNLDAGVLKVCRTWTKSADGAWVVGSTKSGKSRHIALSAAAVDALRVHGAKQKRERFRLGPDYTNSDLVFCRRDGKPLNPDSLDHRFRLLLERAGLPHIRVHDLRHSCASLLLANGAPIKAVSEMLGHSDIGITLNIYAHVDMEQQRAVANLMSQILAS